MEWTDPQPRTPDVDGHQEYLFTWRTGPNQLGQARLSENSTGAKPSKKKSEPIILRSIVRIRTLVLPATGGAAELSSKPRRLGFEYGPDLPDQFHSKRN